MTPKRPAHGGAASRWERLNQRVWPWVTWTLGGLLWVQMFALGLGFELGLAAPRPWALLAYLMPLGVLTLGVLWRSQVLLLTLVLCSSLPGLVVLPPEESAAMLAPASFLRIGLSILLYLAMASAGVTRKTGWDREGVSLAQQETAVPGTTRPKAQIDEPGVLRRFIFWRIGVLVVLFVVPSYAVFADAQVGEAIATHYAENAMAARTFFALVHFFIWSVASYMMVLVPSMNIEYDRKRFDKTILQAFEHERSGRILARSAAVGLVTSVSAGLLWWGDTLNIKEAPMRALVFELVGVLMLLGSAVFFYETIVFLSQKDYVAAAMMLIIGFGIIRVGVELSKLALVIRREGEHE